MTTKLEKNGYIGKLEVIDETKVGSKHYAVADIQVGSKRRRWTVAGDTQDAARAAAEAKARAWFDEFAN